MNKFSRYGLRIIGLIMLAFILSRLDLSGIVRQLMRIRAPWFALAVVLILPTIYIRALRWRYAMSVLGVKLGRYEAFHMHLASSFIGQVTPGRIGEFVKALYVKAPLHRSVTSIIIDRLFDVTVLVLLSSAGLAMIPADSLKVAIIALAAIIFGAIILIFLLSERLVSMAARIFDSLLPRKIGKRAMKGTSSLWKSFKAYKSRDYGIMAWYTLLSNIVHYMVFYAAARSINLDIPLMYLVSCLAITSIVSFLPISFLGIGTRDISLVFMFSLIGLSSESAIAYSTLILAINLIGALFGAIAWLTRPVEI